MDGWHPELGPVIKDKVEGVPFKRMMYRPTRGREEEVEEKEVEKARVEEEEGEGSVERRDEMTRIGELSPVRRMYRPSRGVAVVEGEGKREAGEKRGQVEAGEKREVKEERSEEERGMRRMYRPINKMETQEEDGEKKEKVAKSSPLKEKKEEEEKERMVGQRMYRPADREGSAKKGESKREARKGRYHHTSLRRKRDT